MDFEFNYAQKTLADSIARCIKANLPAPPARVRQYDDAAQHVWRSLVELGAVGALFDQDVGGYGEDAFDLVNVFQVLGRELLVDQPFLAVLLAGKLLASSSAHRQCFDDVLEGTTVSTLAHCEADGMWEPHYVTTRAQAQGDGWVLDGVKAAVPHAAQASVLLVTARTAGDAHDENGISLFLVPATHPGVTIRAYPEIDGAHAAEVRLQSVVVDKAALVGQAGGAFAAVAQSIAYGALALCAQAVGVMDVLINATTEYVKVRKQFGAPIGVNQALQHRIVEMMAAAEESRSALINAAACTPKSGTEFRKAVAAAKITVGRAATLISEEAIQLHGGIGITWELDAAHYAAWLAMFNSRLGDVDSHLNGYLALDAA